VSQKDGPKREEQLSEFAKHHEMGLEELDESMPDPLSPSPRKLSVGFESPDEVPEEYWQGVDLPKRIPGLKNLLPEVLLKSLQHLADGSNFGAMVDKEDKTEAQLMFEAALAGRCDRSDHVPARFAERSEFNGKQEEEALGRVVAATAKLFMAALEAEDGGPTANQATISDEELDALGEVIKPVGYDESEAFQLEESRREELEELSIETLEPWQDETPHKEISFGGISWGQPTSGKGKLVPTWAVGAPIGCDPRRSVEHVLNVAEARRKNHYPLDAGEDKMPASVLNALEQQAKKHGLGAGGTTQVLPVLEETKQRLEKIGEQLAHGTGAQSMREAGELVGELLHVTEARIQKVWRCCEILCTKYARETGTPLSTRREELQLRMKRLREVIEASMPEMQPLKLEALEPKPPSVRAYSAKSQSYRQAIAAERANEEEENDRVTTPAAERRMGNLKASTFTQDASKVLRKWFFDHFSHPYPEKEEKERLCNETGLTAKQLNDWFSNWRKRVWNRGMANQPKPDMSKAMAAMGHTQ